MGPRSRSNALVAVAASVALVLGVGVAIVVLAVRSLDDIDPLGNNVANERVSRPQCDRLAAVRLTAQGASDTWFATSDDWPAFRSALAPRLVDLERALRAADPAVHAGVRRDIRATTRQVTIGRAELAYAHGLRDYMTRIDNGVVDGYLALGRLDNRIDDQCGFAVAPTLPEVRPPTNATRP